MEDVITVGAEATEPVSLDNIKTKLFADGADIERIARLAEDPRISGFTTNPTLMRKVGIDDYEGFAQKLVERVPSLPISLEVFADDADEIRRQAQKIASWGDNVYVKIPVTTSEGESLADLARELSEGGVQINVTALMTPAQTRTIATAVADGAPSFISVFAGRVADSGVDPVPLMAECVEIIEGTAPNSELIWASPREVLNLVQANAVGCHIITMTHDLLAKLGSVGKNLDQFSLETVQMFRQDALAAAFEI
jgi:transaldolase